MKKIILKENEVLVLRSVNENLQSRGGFQYPSKGLVECTDWEGSNKCGNGLHGLEFGNTKSYDICEDYSGKFLIIRVNKLDGYVVLDNGDKVKFKKGYVELVLDNYQEVLDYLYKNYKTYYKSYYGFTQIAGDDSTQTAGYESTQNAGYESTQTARGGSTQNAGNYSFHCLRGDYHIVKPAKYSLISIIGYGREPDMYQFMYKKDFIEGETLLINKGVITKYTTTPENITELQEHEIFVFGSNGQGEHNGGAALIAKEKFGAVQGKANGLQGDSFAINTMDGLDKIKEGLQELYKQACSHTTKIFFLTKIGCGIAGHSEDDIKNIVSEIIRPANVILPQGW